MSSCANEDYQDGDCVVNNYNSLISAAIASSVPVSGYVNLFRAPMLLTALIRQDFLPSWLTQHGKPLVIEHLA